MKKTTIKMFLRKNLIVLLFLSATVVVLQGCYPYDDRTVSNSDVVATFYESGTNFSALVTYFMPDSVFEIDSNGDIVPADINSSYAQQILTSTNNNLEEMGYQMAANLNAADVVVEALVTSSTWVSGGCYGGYYSYWYPYYGWCYPVAYTYTTGTILLVMSVPETNNFSTVWVAGINGILGSTTSSTTSRINKDIDQAFNQSPYLRGSK